VEKQLEKVPRPFTGGEKAASKEARKAAGKAAGRGILRHTHADVSAQCWRNTCCELGVGCVGCVGVVGEKCLGGGCCLGSRCVTRARMGESAIVLSDIPLCISHFTFYLSIINIILTSELRDGNHHVGKSLVSATHILVMCSCQWLSLRTVTRLRVTPIIPVTCAKVLYYCRFTGTWLLFLSVANTKASNTRDNNTRWRLSAAT
jgi:hypothetical protein